MVIGLKTTVLILILLALITCTCNGPRLMLGSRSSENLIEYSLFTGRRVKPTTGLMECAILKTEGQASLLCLQQNPSLKQQLLQMHGLGYCPNLELMLKRCLQTRLYQYLQTTPSSSNQFKTEWIDLKQNLPTECQHQNLQEKNIEQKQTDELAGLDTTIDWKNTGDNSYDGEKLRLLVHDESGKWERPDNILNSWRVTKTCLRLGRRVIGNA